MAISRVLCFLTLTAQGKCLSVPATAQVLCHHLPVIHCTDDCNAPAASAPLLISQTLLGNECARLVCPAVIAMTYLTAISSAG